MKAYTYAKSGLTQFLDVEKPVVCVNGPTLFVRMVKNTIHDVNLHIMKSNLLASVPIKFLFSDFEQNSFVIKGIYI